jgi:[ribosomal protein S5]-alanine N-acetyltransferase
MMETIPELETPRLRLRAWVEADAEVLHAAFGDPETMRFWNSPARTNVADTAALIRESRQAPPWLHAAFAITFRDTGEPVGMVNYHDRRPANRRLAVGWILIRARQRQGIMREAMPAMLRYCFNTLDAHRIEARIEAANGRSVALANWLGFQREGLMRDWMFVGNEPRSPHMHSLLRPDWAARPRSRIEDAGGGRK